MKEVYIVSAVRTPMGSFGGSLADVSATRLGALAIKGALEKIKLDPELVQEVYMGNVISANLGQAPARQAALFAGLPQSVICTTINKVCASSMKAVMLAAQSVMLGENDVVLAGGMENMSQIPHYAPGLRTGLRLADGKLIDGMIKDGLWDVYNNYHMGNAAELCAAEMNFTREEQDRYAVQSYKRAAAATESGKFKDEIIPIEVETRKGKVLVEIDEEYKNVAFDKIPQLKPVFKKDGTVTAANASTINDGASAVVLMSKEKAEQLGIKPLARIVSFADAEQAPEWFTTAPAKSIKKALGKIGKSTNDIDYFEINEAFSAVALAAVKELNLDEARVNVNGGAVALGHPLGSSGSRIIVTLINVLKQNGGKLGVASLCNGGGGASAVVIENIG